MEAKVEQGVFETIGGYRTHYHEAGAGEGKPLLLIHGSGPGVSAWANWRLVFPLLADDFQLYAPDLVGFGQTEKPRITYSVDVWVDHLIAFIEQKNLAPVSIIGNSLGGALALHIAHRRPEWIDKLILMGSAGIRFQLTEGLDKVWGYEPSLENMRNLIRIFAYDQTMAEKDDLVEMRYKASIQEGAHESYASMFPAPRQRWVDELSLSEEALRSIDKPTLLIHGREDRVLPVAETSWRLAQLLPRAEFHMFSQCGHWTQIEKTEAFCRLVKHFLKNNG
ncbi:alpha/beta fold hydrolase [Kyrpidia tusciae]|uniref:Alpha/beta hydrolase fold protein n=1 Tax=Kyrpidia tusciae (strain DSM 2912 / NBRC 15312 / T2) TaxID=562970 RepID=D5WS47_KYRT2|nr:alpha/beta hydrolase fold protein [Kyrpidia tusciae DSM 2912]